MGACCTKKSDKQAGIQFQIEQTVFEQQKLREEEEEIQVIQGIRDFSTKRSMNIVQTTLASHQEQDRLDDEKIDIIQEEEKPKEKQVKKTKAKVVKDDINYFKKYEHVLHVKQIIVELEQNQNFYHYSLVIRVDYKDYINEAKMIGVLITHSDFHNYQLLPKKFNDANKYARFSTFFSNDNYFNADKDSINNNNAFDKLLNVERIVSIKQVEKKLKRRQTMMEREHDSPQKKNTEFLDQHQHETLEVITIIDVEEQARFLCLLFHLILQQQFPELGQYLIFIQNTTFLFDRPPQFDQPNVYRIAIFYDRLNYSLKDLQQVLTKENQELSNFMHMKLSLDLLKILYHCYSKYIFRLNITLSTIFYVHKFKCFKLESFGRLKSLLPFQANAEQSLKTVDEKKFHTYKKTFHKDLFAICDLMIYFKRINGQSLRTIAQKRKKFLKSLEKGETEELSDNYIHLAEELFSKEHDKYLLEFVKIVLFSANSENVDVTLTNIEAIMESMQKQIFKFEAKLEQEQLNKDNDGEVINLDEINLSQSAISQENENNFFKNFDIDFNAVYDKQMRNKEKLTDVQQIYKEIYYESLYFQNDNYDELSRIARSMTLPKLEQAQILILNTFHYIKQMKDDSWETKSQTVSQLIEEAVPILNSIGSDNIDHFHIGILFQIVTLSLRKPIVLLNQLQRCITKQLQFKQKMHQKLRGKNQAKGLIEQKKHVMMQTMFAQSYLQNNNYFEAISKIQKIVGFQLKNQHNSSLLYGYSLLVSGEIARLSSQPVSAMLNLEMSLSIYNQFFPETLIIEVISDEFKKQKENEFPNLKEEQQVVTKIIKFENLATTNLARVEFLLGMSYFDSHDQENSLKSLRRAQQLMQRQYSIFADEVIALVIQQLHIYVLQDDVGAAMKIAMTYNREMNEFYRQGKEFRRKRVSKLQFIIGCIFQFSGSYLSALRYIERSNRTLTKSKTNNFIIQAHFQAKKMTIIEQIKRAFSKIRSKQSIKNTLDLSSFQSLNDVIGSAFQNQFFCQPSKYHSSIFFKKLQKNVMRVQELDRINEKDNAINLINELIKQSSKGQKDEFYAYLKYKLCMISVSNDQFSEKQLDEYCKLSETFDRYLQFPLKQQYKLQIQLIIFLLLTKLGEVRKLNQLAAKIDDFITEIYQIFNWQVAPPRDGKHNGKFEKLNSKGNIQLLIQIQYISDLIQFFYLARKKIFDQFDNLQQQKEIGGIWLKKLLNLKSYAYKFIEKKQDCLLGYQQYVKIKVDNENENNTNTKSDHKQKKLQIIQESQKVEEEPQEAQKLVFDLRTYEEILESHKQSKQVRHSKQMSQDVEKEVKKENVELKASKHKRNITEMTAATQSQKMMKSSFKIDPFKSSKMKKKIKS